MTFDIVVRERTTRFATLDAARDAAQDFFERTGNIVAITESTDSSN